jgi:hypothetical protein
MKTPTPSRPETTLLLSCGVDIQMAAFPGMPGERIEVFGALYRDTGYGDFTGFYDWLRSPEGVVIGLRWWPFGDLGFVLETLRGREYASLDPAEEYVDIWFGSERVSIPEEPKEQDFVGNKVLVSDSGDYVLSFHAGLAPEVLAGMTRMPIAS